MHSVIRVATAVAAGLLALTAAGCDDEHGQAAPPEVQPPGVPSSSVPVSSSTLAPGTLATTGAGLVDQFVAAVNARDRAMAVVLACLDSKTEVDTSVQESIKKQGVVTIEPSDSDTTDTRESVTIQVDVGEDRLAGTVAAVDPDGTDDWCISEFTFN